MVIRRSAVKDERATLSGGCGGGLGLGALVTWTCGAWDRRASGSDWEIGEAWVTGARRVGACAAQPARPCCRAEKSLRRGPQKPCDEGREWGAGRSRPPLWDSIVRVRLSGRRPIPEVRDGVEDEFSRVCLADRGDPARHNQRPYFRLSQVKQRSECRQRAQDTSLVAHC